MKSRVPLPGCGTALQAGALFPFAQRTEDAVRCDEARHSYDGWKEKHNRVFFKLVCLCLYIWFSTSLPCLIIAVLIIQLLLSCLVE